MAGSERLYPFFKVEDVGSATVEDLEQSYTHLLTEAGYQCVGKVTLTDIIVLVFTSDKMQKIAGRTRRGAYGAVFRLSLTKVDDQVQVLCTSPAYWSAAYRMDVAMKEVDREVREALVQDKTPEYCGSEKGKSEATLRKYQYTIGMPNFNEPMSLRKFSSLEEATSVLDTNLASGVGGVHRVYRVDLPGGGGTVFGVHMEESPLNEFSDARILQEVDLGSVRHSAHLPWEIVVSPDGKVEALSAKFRIALSFPDLPMAGFHSFASIMSCPAKIEKALKLATAKQ
mmetsp:Transcript_26635/g.74448  ORF Transcript_26635/g.74448 Transcript_26635/m.74448 type:complete len:284 (-) Transcript_26635:151-1002(-)|eukprot:CAMPEP_0119126438 /NCGR_PEP_ID=MMETSP1310-20130426/5364_1 /TAXON_ID=464262 /ORGANISM="Genus nov. species nov., Strain RCC2339" /LENGTH=283 /DNA_ID=CAMNT_0007116599 /DNA_START=208 /DNA_END=1059 /DNA_ORIENTATION=+